MIGTREEKKKRFTSEDINNVLLYGNVPKSQELKGQFEISHLDNGREK